MNIRNIIFENDENEMNCCCFSRIFMDFLGIIGKIHGQLVVNLANLASPTQSIPTDLSHDTFQDLATHDPPWTEVSLPKGMEGERDQ